MKFVALLLISIPAFAQGILTAGNAASGSSNIAPGSIVAVTEFFVFSIPTHGDLDPLHSRASLQLQGSVTPLQILPNSTAFAIYALVPDRVPMGPTSLILSHAGNADVSFPVNVVAAGPGLFVQSGALLAQNDSATTPPSRNALSNPVIPGQYVTLWGTGLGNSTTADITVEIGGRMVPASFAGRNPGSPGVDQINFKVPVDAPAGCYVPLSIHAGNMASNEGSLALSNLPGVCQHPLGLSAAEMSTLDQGGGIMFGSIAISRSVAAPELLSLGFDSYEGASAQFGTQDAWSIFALAQPQPPDELYYTCQVPGSPVSYFAPDGRNATGDAGTSLTLTGPSGTRLDLRKIGSNFLVPSADGQYTGSPPPISGLTAPPFFAAGSWAIQAPGGLAIGAFQQTFSLPPLHWTNRDALSTVSRKAGATISWNPQGYGADDVMTIRLTNTGYPDLSCRTHATSGEFTLPAAVLQQLTPSVETVLSLTATPHPAHRSLFRLPLTGGGTAPAVIDYSFSDARLVDLQ